MYSLINNISPLSRVLLLASDPQMSDASRRQLAEEGIAEDIVPSVLKHAQRNGFSSLLYKNLSHLNIKSESFREQLKQQVLNILIQQLRQEAVFRELNQILSIQGINYRVLKGFFLARTIYPEVYLRPMTDLDILIEPKSISKGFELLRQHGFVSYPISEHRLISIHNHHPYGLKFKGVNIELHQSIFSDYEPERIHEKLLWETPEVFTINSEKVYTLSTEVFLFHLCHHLTGHLRGDFIKLIWCRDIAEFVKHYNDKLDWNLFLKFYQDSKATEDLFHGLWFAHDWMNAPVPQIILEKIKTPGDEIARDFLWFAEHEKNNKSRPHLIKKFNHVQGVKSKIIFFILKMFPAPSYLMRHYRSKSWWSLFYIYPRHISGFIYRGIKALI